MIQKLEDLQCLEPVRSWLSRWTDRRCALQTSLTNAPIIIHFKQHLSGILYGSYVTKNYGGRNYCGHFTYSPRLDILQPSKKAGS
jgi:hypothetical protein